MNRILEFLDNGFTFTLAVVGYPVRNDQVLLGERRAVSNNFGLGKVSGIGGKIETTVENSIETPEECLIREFQEEISITPTSFLHLGRVRYIFPTQPKWSNDISIFLINDWLGTPTAIEKVIPLWCPISNLPKNRMWEDNLITLPRIFKKEVFDLVFLYNENESVEQYYDCKSQQLTELLS